MYTLLIACLLVHPTAAFTSSDEDSPSLRCGMPGTAILREHFFDMGLEHFEEKTQILDMLASQEKIPIGIDVALELSLYDYLEGTLKDHPLKQTLYAATRMNIDLLRDDLKEQYCEEDLS
jgi:hypothetical protein